MTDLSKEFDWLPLEFLVVKLHISGFIFLHQDRFTYVTNRKQKAKVNSVKSSPCIKGGTLDDVIKTL